MPATKRPQIKSTCVKCGSRRLEEVGEPHRRELAGFDEATQTHYRAVEWVRLRCAECGQHTRARVLFEAKRSPRPAAKPKASPRRQAAQAKADRRRQSPVCAKSAPTLRKIDAFVTPTEGALVTIPATTNAADYSSDPQRHGDDDEQLGENPRA